MIANPSSLYRLCSLQGIFIFFFNPHDSIVKYWGKCVHAHFIDLIMDFLNHYVLDAEKECFLFQESVI